MQMSDLNRLFVGLSSPSVLPILTLSLSFSLSYLSPSPLVPPLPLDGEHRLVVQLRNRGPGWVPVRRIQGASHCWIQFGPRAEPQDQGRHLTVFLFLKTLEDQAVSRSHTCVCVCICLLLHRKSLNYSPQNHSLPLFYESLHVSSEFSNISCIFPHFCVHVFRRHPHCHLTSTHPHGHFSSRCFFSSLFCVFLSGLHAESSRQTRRRTKSRRMRRRRREGEIPHRMSGLDSEGESGMGEESL